MLVGILIFMLSFFVTSFAEQFTVFLIGMIILTFGEMFVWPAVPTIANYLAPEGKQVNIKESLIQLQLLVKHLDH